MYSIQCETRRVNQPRAIDLESCIGAMDDSKRKSRTYDLPNNESPPNGIDGE
jgi:hypothetical protein